MNHEPMNYEPMSHEPFEIEEGFFGGLTEPTASDLAVFSAYAAENRKPFRVLGAEQFRKGQVFDYADGDFQEFLSNRIAFASRRGLVISPPASCGLNQGGIGSCSGASATGAQMSALYNNTLFGVPAAVPRLNCMLMYVKARGSYGSGASIVSVQHAVMDYGNASAASAGEYQVKRPRTLTGFDNEKHQCWTCNVQKLEQVVQLCKAGIPVCFGSSRIPKQFNTSGRVSGWGSGNHAMALVGYHHQKGLIRWQNSWGIVNRSDVDGSGWGAWMSIDELENFSMFSRFGEPYGIAGQEYQIC